MTRHEAANGLFRPLGGTRSSMRYVVSKKFDGAWGVLESEWVGGGAFAISLATGRPLEWVDINRLLSRSEYQTYLRFPVEKRRAEYLLGRVSAKSAVSTLGLGQPLEDIDIQYGVFGQPVVAGCGNIQVSISHSAGIGFSSASSEGVPIGVDVESVREENACAIREYLTESDRAHVDSLQVPQSVSTHLFWTAKESLSKVLRCGLTVTSLVLEIEEMKVIRTDVLLGRFRHFPGYRCLSFVVHSSLVASMVFPSRLLNDRRLDEVAQDVLALIRSGIIEGDSTEPARR